MKAWTILLLTMLAFASGFAVTLQLKQEPATQTSATSPLRLSASDQSSGSLVQIKQKRDLLMVQLQQIEERYGVTARSVRELTLKIQTKQRELKRIQQQIRHYRTEQAWQSAALAQQLKASFMFGQQQTLHLLLNQQDPSRISRVMRYQYYWNQARFARLTQLKTTLDQLVQLEQQQRQQMQLLTQVMRSHQLGQQDLQQSQLQRAQLLAKLNQEFADKSSQLAQLNQNIAEAEALFAKLQTTSTPPVIESQAVQAEVTTTAIDTDGNLLSEPSPAENIEPLFSQLKGQIPWPIHAPIIKKFASPRFAGRWDGVLMAAKEGTEIHSVAGGEVVFADWLRGYGLLLIINHGEDYMSLYAFNQSLYKKVGEKVKAGEVIAAVGKSDGREASGLYFGIRYKGKAIDPAKWCE
ncbi:MAG: hypothetical protein RL637_1578 [Pseudomonadota bacterium]